MGYTAFTRFRRLLLTAVVAATMFSAFGSSPASAAITCTKTQTAGESVSAFLNRLGSYEEGCLLAGTYDLGGNLTNFKAGQKLHPAPAAGGGYQQVTLRGTMTLKVNDLVLDDLFIVGVQNSQNSKIVEIGACNYCKLDHLDITSSPQYVAFQGILNYASTTGLEITNNKIHHVGGNGQFDHGIYCHNAMTGGVIRGNWIYANASFGIQFYPDCDGVDFSYNVVDGNGMRAGCTQGQDCPASTTNGRGITVSGEGSTRTDNVNAHNNVLSTYGGASFAVLACYTPGTGDWMRDSLLYQGSGADDDCGSSISRSNLIHSLSPAYLDRANRDYRLQSSSPARTLMGAYADAVPGPRLDSGSPPPADTTPPETTIGSGPSGTVTSGSASFAFSSSESGSSFECRIDGGAWGACSSPQAYSALADGSHSFEVRARDAAGNTDASPASRSWTIDSTAPDTTLTGGPSGTVNSSSASFTFASEAGASFECRIDSGAWGACSSPKAYSALADGSHAFDVRAKDAAGNADPSPASRSWTIDATAPSTTLGSGPSGTVNTDSASFSFSSEAGASFECRIDSGAWGACTSPKAYSSLAEGSHSFDVRARDAAGNTDPSPASRSWTIDTTAPETSIGSGPSGSTEATSASFGFSSSESGSSFECRIDSGAWGACTSPKAYSSLAEGSHSFEVRATDAAGNADASPASRTWTVEPPAPSPAPSVSFEQPTAGQTVSGQLDEASGNCVAAVSSSGTIDRVEFFVDDQLVNTDRGAPYACVVATTGYADGAHTIKAVAYDGSGQTGSATVDVNFSNASPEPPPPAPPVVSFTAPTGNQKVSGVLEGDKCRAAVSSAGTIDRVDFFVDGTPSGTDNDAPWNCRVDTRGYPDGQHTLKAVAHDTRGQEGSASVTLRFSNHVNSGSSKPSGATKSTTSLPGRGRLRLRLSARRRTARGPLLRFAVSMPVELRTSVRGVRIQAFRSGHWRTVARAGSPAGRCSVRWRVRGVRSGRRLRIRAVARGALPSRALRVRLHR